MSINLDYRPPHKDRPPASAVNPWAIIAVVCEHLFVFLFYSATLDGGVLARDCFIVSVAFWLVVGLIFWLRRRNLKVTDQLFIAFGYPAMLIPCLIARGHLI